MDQLRTVGGRTRVVPDNISDLGIGPLMRVNAWVYQIDDTDEQIRSRMKETSLEVLEEGETRQAALPSDLDAPLSLVRSLGVIADLWPRRDESRKEFTILSCIFSRAPTVIEVLGLARDSYLACMFLASRTNNGGPGMGLDEGLLTFAEGAEARISKSPVIQEIISFDPRATVYCSYTAWWEGNETFLDEGSLILKPALGS